MLKMLTLTLEQWWSLGVNMLRHVLRILSRDVERTLTGPLSLSSKIDTTHYLRRPLRAIPDNSLTFPPNRGNYWPVFMSAITWICTGPSESLNQLGTMQKWLADKGLYVCVLLVQSCLTLCYPMDCIARQAPLSIEFFRQEHWSRFPFPSPGDLSDPGIQPGSPVLQADYLPSEPSGKP